MISHMTVEELNAILFEPKSEGYDVPRSYLGFPKYAVGDTVAIVHDSCRENQLAVTKETYVQVQRIPEGIEPWYLVAGARGMLSITEDEIVRLVKRGSILSVPSR